MATSAKTPLSKTIYTGTFIHTPTLGSLEVLEDAAIGVDEQGIIRHVETSIGFGEDKARSVVTWDVVKKWGWNGEEEKVEWVERVKQGGGRGDGCGWFFPGFVDTHIHAPQYPNTGLFGSSTLLSWLKTYTFPLESTFSSLATAQKIYTRVIQRTLAHGTTTAAYYATLHVPATNLLSTLCHQLGQRAKVGRVCMDSSINESYYKDESSTTALAATRETITHTLTIDPQRELVESIITPRFAPSCTAECLTGLGELAKEHDLPIQTHIAENRQEIALVKDLFPACASYTDVYASHNLLTPRTVLGHAIHLSAHEQATVKQHEAGVAHCPVSNSYLSSGLCPVRKLLDMGIKVGLGTDVSGGWSPSVLVAAREALGVSRILASVEDSKAEAGNEKDDVEENKVNIEKLKLSVEEVLYLATMGGARCLGLEAKVGTFEVGKEFDAQLISCANWSPNTGAEENEKDNPVELWGPESSWPEKLAKWVFCGDDRNVRKVWVKGREVHDRAVCGG